MASGVKVVGLPGIRVPSNIPDSMLVESLEKLLDLARSGELRSFIGTGFCAGGHDGKPVRLAYWADTHDNVYEMLGAIEWLKHEWLVKNDYGG